MLVKLYKNNLIKALLFAFVALSGIIVSTLIANYFKKPIEIIPESKVQLILCSKDFNGFDVLPKNQIVKLIDKKIPAYAANGQFVNPTIVVAKRGGVGSEVACGYLYIKAGTESNGPLRSWENVYINPHPFGGHIADNKSISSKHESLFTELLFSLDNISYRANKDSQEVKSANWAALMNVSDIIEFNISLNTEDRSGFIEEISIGYRCFNPETGKETHDCRFEVIERRGL